MGLERQFAAADTARHQAELAASASKEACIELTAKHSEVVLDLTMAHHPTMAHHRESSATVLAEMARPQQVAVVAARLAPSFEANADSDRLTVLESARQKHLECTEFLKSRHSPLALPECQDDKLG